ncbi:unnamed protein product [Fraxinus pennsylvanica]|uniref:AAA+ ATPase domain-containing protein n=1 Tax=Fraxinus pennsylvanica TaxID=56036 RepID=A0AAD1ZEC2_9LAMI|nr:unnamed protein product [Fraxinus pennsylvanica]
MPVTSPHKLTDMEVWHCDKLLTIAESDSIQLLQNLGNRYVEGCNALEVLFDSEGIKNLRNKVQELENKRHDVKRQVDAAKRNAESIGEEVSAWLQKVDDLTKKAHKILNSVAGSEMRCLFNRCPNLKSRYLLSRRATKKTIEADKLKGEGTFERGFETRLSTKEEIKEALKDKDIGIIGIYGMPGVGKTTMAKEIVNEVKDEKLFDETAFAVVSNDPDINKIQDQLAEALGLKIEEKTNKDVRAGRLRQRLEGNDGKSILVILDDVWTEIDLGTIGIPSPRDRRGLKIMFTTRIEETCSKMEAKAFKIEVLSEVEGWQLFTDKAGISDDETDVELVSLAKEVAKECGRLPLALEVVGSTLKGKKTVYEWKDALRRLKKSSATNIVDKSIRLSYDYLANNEEQNLLLLCSLFAEDESIPIENLVRYARGLELFEETETLCETRDGAKTIADKLKGCNLLQPGTRKDEVKLHDVIRDFCLHMAKKEKRGYLVNHAGLKEWPEHDAPESCSAISITFDELDQLPTGLKYRNVKLLRNKVRELENKRDDVRLLVGAAERNAESIGEEVSAWLQKVDDLKQKAHEILNSVAGSEMRCLFNRCPNLKSRYLLSRRATKKTIEADKLKGEGTFERVGYPRPPVQELNLTSHEGFETRLSTKKKIKEALKDKDIGIIGICGMPGVDINKIQDQLAEALGLKIEEKTNKDARAGRLHERLNNDKSILVVLDDLWKKIDLGTIGIPSPNGQNRLKIMFTTRREDTCIKMEAKAFKIEVLSAEEGWQLFTIKAGISDDETDGELVSLAKEVANECGRLPLALEVVGSALKGKKAVYEWKDALRQLKTSIATNLEGMDDNVYKIIRLSYDYLVSNEERDLLLLCSLFAEDESIPIENLVRYARGLELFKETETLCETRARAKTIANNLKSCNLLQLGVKEDEVKLHDVIRDFCLQMAKKEKRGYLLLGKETSLPKLKDIWVSYCAELLTIVESDSIQSLQNLEDLYVRKCYAFEVLFDFEGMKVTNDDAEINMLGRLTSLKLGALPNLVHIIRMVPKGIRVFQNLTNLTVVDCKSLIYLFSPSMANSLVALKDLQVSFCNSIKAIVGKEEEEEEEEEGTSEIKRVEAKKARIEFPKLELLRLRTMWSIQMFCSQNCDLVFPLLKDLTIENCRMMTKLSPWPVSAPRLDISDYLDNADSPFNSTLFY